MSHHTQQRQQAPAPTYLQALGLRQDFPPNPQLLARLTALRSKVTSIRQDVGVREYFQRVEENGQYYCAVCTPRQFPAGTCGSTCTLLRPLDKASSPYKRVMTADWLRDHDADKTTYQNLTHTLNHFGTNISLELLSRLEKTAEKLRLKARNQSELYAEDGWRNVPPIVRGVFKAYWTIEKGWGKGKKEVEQVPPNSKVVRRTRVVREKVERTKMERLVKRKLTRRRASKAADEEG